MKEFRFILRLVYVILLFQSILNPRTAQAQEDQPVVVISPGHGWRIEKSGKIASGVTNGDLVEKDINLEVARYVRTYLNRCPVKTYLTRDGDDPDHTLYDVDEIVNGYNPTVGVSIHTNSFTGNQTGTEGWYTVAGYDDKTSQYLAASLAGQIASRLGIPYLGTKPETDYSEGGLYIHHWKSPSALVEIAEIHGDAELLRNQKDDFGRSIAQAILEYLDIDPHCADWAIPQGFFVATYFPGEAKTNQIRLRNDSLLEWNALRYFLNSQGNNFGADDQYPLFQDTPVKEVATWEIPAVAPLRAGVFRQDWLLVGSSTPVSERVTVYLIVVPEAARELKEEIDRRIEEFLQSGEDEIEEFIKQLEEEMIKWIEEFIRQLEQEMIEWIEELPGIICPQQPLLFGLAAGITIMLQRKRK